MKCSFCREEIERSHFTHKLVDGDKEEYIHLKCWDNLSRWIKLTRRMQEE